MPDLGSTLSLNSSAFAAGIATARAKLTELNTALIENRNKMKEVSKEAQELQKRERELSAEMKDGGTKEQQQEMQQLRDRIGQVNAELGTLRTREREIQSDIRRASNELDNQKNGMNNLANAGDGVANSLKKIETGLKSVFTMAATKKLVDFFIGSNAEMEQYLTSFEVMLGDAKKASELMSSLNDMAAKTPMELTDVVSTGTLLMNYGVSADELIAKMTQLGDLASGNAVKFERVSLAYGQMLAKGKVSGEELRQMTEAGVPLLQALADTLGVSTGEVQNLVSKGKVGITELDAAIASLTTGTGQFAGMMEKQSQTFSGMLSTLSDEATQFGRDVGEKAFEVAKDGLAELLEMLDEWRADGTLDEIAEDAGEAIGNFAELIKNASTFLIENKETVIGAITAYAGLKTAINVGSEVKSTIDTIQKTTAAVKALGPATLTTIAQVGGLVGVIAAVGLEAGYYIDKIAGLSDEVESTQRSVERLTDSMNDSISENEAEMNVIKSKAAEYENLRNTQNLNAEQEERLKTLAGELQGVLGDEIQVVNSLTGEYNDLSAAIENYVEQQTKKVKFSALEDSAKEAYKKIDEIKRKMQERSADHTEYQQNFSAGRILDWNGAVETTSFLNDMAAYREEIAKCQQIIDDYNTALSEGAYVTAEASAAVDEATEKAKELEEQLARTEERQKTIDDLTDATKNLVSEFGSLTDTLKALQSGEAISYEKMQALIKIYPELANHIQVTADGYVVETGALGDLNTALANSANAQIEAENAKTRAAIEGAKERISLYEKEAQAAGMYEHDPQKVLEIGKRISEERAYITELESKLAVNSTLPDYFASNKGSSSGKTSSAKKEDSPTLKSISSYAKTANSAFTEMKDKGELALSTVQALIDAGYESALQYDSATGKWTISAEKYKMAAESQIEAAKKVKGVTETEQNALETLRKSLDSVTNGTYELSNAQEKLSTISGISKNMSTLSGAVSEQKKSGALSTDTVADIIGTEYEKALTVGVDGKITLDTDKLKTVLSDEIDKAIKDLEESLKTAEKGDIPALEAQIQAFKMLKDSISEVTEGLYGVKEKLVSDEEIKAIEESANRRLKLIDDELKAKQKLRDETLKAIDEEVQARKRLTEDNDIQRQIDQVMAQLKYSQLDDFSRSQLERKLQSLKNDKADMIWERGIEDRRAAANEQFDADSEKLNAEKDAINNSLEVLNRLNDTFASGISDLGETIKAAMEAVKPDSTVNITLNNADKMTAEQLYAFIEQQYGSTGAI